MAGLELDPSTRRALAAWLSECVDGAVDADALAIDTPSSGGWSNDTWIVDTGVTPARLVVVRLEPTRASMFPTYDLERQLRCLTALDGEPDVPTPSILGDDLAGRRLGRPAFVMAHVAGRTPSDDRPTFAESGWLAEATPDEQRVFHESLLDAVAAVHAVDVVQRGLGGLQPAGDGSSNHRALAGVEALWDFDRGPSWPTAIDAALAELAEDVPAPGEDGLLWGDARPANVVVAADGFRPIALLDWELASIGTPELDVTWLLEMNHMRIQGAGLVPPAGFLSDAEVVDHYEARTGRVLHDVAWYRYLAAVRVAVFMHRYLRALVHAGRLAPDHEVLADTVASRRLASLRGPSLPGSAQWGRLDP